MKKRALLVVVLAACGSNASSSDVAAPAELIAFGPDFAGFHGWKSFTPTTNILGNDHLSGPRTIFVNHLPPPGSTAFPIGTIFVKESGTGDVLTRNVFASVKRGGDFNASGAVNWEWFQLTNTASDQPIIQWRGFGPATGNAYGGDATGGCNGCHWDKQWDYAWSAEEFGLLGGPPR